MEREILRAALAPGADCLSMEELGRYADGALGPAEQTAAAAHVDGCLNCQAELALMRAVTSTAAPAPRRRWMGLGALPLAAAAAVVLMVGGVLYVRTEKPPELPRATPSGGEVTRSLAVSVRGPLGDQTEAPRRLEWLAVERAVRYRVRLMEVDRREIWSATTSDPGVDLPSTIRASLTAPRALRWDVTAYNASDAVIAESGLQSFRLVVR